MRNVFVEKPLCLNYGELESIVDGWHKHQPLLMVGFNRRFSSLATILMSSLGDGPISMLYRISAGRIPDNSWIQDAELGGGRIIREVCHFIDFMVYLTGSNPTRVYADTLADPSNFQDTVNINLAFENGSIGTICYF